MKELTFIVEFEHPLIFAGVPDPLHNVWTPEALRELAAEKPEELRYDEGTQTLYIRQGARVQYADDSSQK